MQASMSALVVVYGEYLAGTADNHASLCMQSLVTLGCALGAYWQQSAGPDTPWQSQHRLQYISGLADSSNPLCPHQRVAAGLATLGALQHMYMQPMQACITSFSNQSTAPAYLAITRRCQ